MKFFSRGAALLPFASFVIGIDFNPDNESSIRTVAAKYASGLMSHYKNGASGTPSRTLASSPSRTTDKSHVDTLTQALVANYGPNNDILLPWRKDQEGNDDQAFWALAVMSALEYSFPEPQKAPATYLEVAKNCFDNIASRWDTKSCNGGLKWQIYPENDYGYNYKNSISNGAFFALAARLASYTGNKTYADWAVKTWDWTKAVGLINDKYAVFDGTDDKKNCTDQDPTEWSYNVGIYLHGAAAMYSYTKGSETWKTHTAGLLDHTATFFKPFDNATGIMFEQACETGLTGRHCNLDQQSFKAYLARFMAKTALLAPFTKEKITNYLRKSAVAAAKSCSGPQDACGSKWYTGGYDGTAGVGQQLSALEVTQALLMIKKNQMPGTGGDQKPSPTSATYSAAKSTSSIADASSSGASTGSASSTPAPSTATATVASTAASAAASSQDIVSGSSVVDSTQPSSTQDATPSVTSGAPGGIFAPQSHSSGSFVTSCTPTSTVTVYIPPESASASVAPTSAPPAVPPPPPVPTTPSGTAPTSPPVSSTSPGPALFTGAAASVQNAAFSIVGAFGMAILAGLL
ncbi:glycosyl hydrolase family 76-domain-containing protein [Clohesyomyces aquaticus]|uniref:mannan endo-1,6-alpha-mannosidase n=1 Tax=Clohesyomyces aquaticus TaxID=1231657 RepID=A0A1Y1ZE36_9PLEO|nr:glycosyl hydrolase family 76-domain-containing protein [Clohesyomyces aquaticus]